jgi:hypothetical protein
MVQIEMTSQYKLNDAQLAVLRWVADGSPEDVMEGYSHRLSAAALRSRGLIKISGRGPTWRAQITADGESFLSEIAEAARRTEEARSASKGAVGPSEDVQVGEATGHAVPEPPGSAVSSQPAQAEIPKFVLPKDLRGAHPLVIATREAASGLRAEPDGRLQIGAEEGVAHLVLSRPLLRRALLLLHGLTRESIKRGWSVVSCSGARRDTRPGIAIEIRGHSYPVEVHELTETLPFTEAEIEAWRTEWKWDLERRAGQMPPPQHKRKQGTGRLRLQSPNGYGGGRASWAEGPRSSFEDRLQEVFETLEERADADDQEAIERARIREERRVEQEAQEVRARRIRIENARVERLVAETKAWRRSEDIRSYVAELEQKLGDLDGDEHTRIAEWCKWAADWADRSDPTRYTSLITGFDDERDEFHYPRR